MRRAGAFQGRLVIVQLWIVVLHVYSLVTVGATDDLPVRRTAGTAVVSEIPAPLPAQRLSAATTVSSQSATMSSTPVGMTIPRLSTALVAPVRPTATSAVVATRTLTPSPTAQADTRGGIPVWGLVSSNGANLVAERAAGIGVQVIRFSWKDLEPIEGSFNADRVVQYRGHLAQLRSAGMAVILEPGFHDTPSWVHAYPNSRYVNQYGDAYSGGGEIDSGDANLVFNPQMRTLVARYIGRVFATFGTDFAAVRLGGGHWGELTYPTQEYHGRVNCYWGFDANAATTNPVPGWRPGQPSPNGEAAQFLDWYLDALVEYQNWQIRTVRQSFTGQIMMLYPSWGVRPGQIEPAVRGNLSGIASPAETGGDLQRGYDFARQVAAISDAKVVVTTTWLDASSAYEHTLYPQDWTPVKYLASLARAHPLQPRLYGENTGRGSATTLVYTASQMRRYSLIGMAWYCERELFSGQYATLSDYQRVIAG